jgi:hypothetical protein
VSTSESRAADRIKSALFLLVLVGVVGYFALRAIPAAQHPALHEQITVPAQSSTTHAKQP